MSSTPTQLLATLRGTRLAVTAFLAIALLVALGRALTGAYVEVLWQAQAGYISAFWTRVFWEWGVRIVAGVSVALLVFVNLKVASTTLGGIQIRRRFGNLEISEQIPKHFVMWAMIGAATLLGLWFGASLPVNVGRRALLLLNAEPWGLVEPIHGIDVGFYVFWIPVLATLFLYALTTVFLLFTLATAGYAATGALSWSRGHITAHRLARVHLGTLLGVFLVMIAARLWFGRYLLLLDGNSGVAGIFGFADAEARLPALQTLTVITLGAAFGTVWGAWKNRSAPLLVSFVAVVLGTILIGEAWPSVVQRFQVEPNELAAESPYIEHNLDFTRIGFGLDGIDERSFEYEAEASIDWVEAARQFAGLPVWNRGPLLATYEELEAQLPYYDFEDVTIDRYPGPDGPVPVAVSVREVAQEGIQDGNWQNLHLRELYVAGMGAVASQAAIRTPDSGPEMLLTGIPPSVAPAGRSVAGIELTRPEVFFGTRGQRTAYAVVSPSAEQYLAPDGAPGVAGVDFPEGIQLSSGLRTALLAWRFRDVNLLFASELTDESRLIYRRRVIERAMAVAPFLRFPEAPYPVVAGGKIVWIIDGFTSTGTFPLSTAEDFGSFRVTRTTYVRNSFKLTVDAVTGEVDLYRVPNEDPLADAFERAYPGLFKPISDMPPETRSHVRYPQELLGLQGRVLLQYHQDSAPVFHGQQDVWDEARELSQNTDPIAYRPEYGIYRLPGDEEARFQLTTVFVPAGRQNLTAMLVGRTDEVGVAELVLIDVPTEVQGPRLIESQIEQDPGISQQFSLWRGAGSEVWTGHLHIVPLGKRILYMEPVFLAAEEDAIPELRRFVVSDGVNVAMTENLGDAIAELAGLRPTTVLTDLETAEALPIPVPSAEWPATALELLDEADRRLRAGDWQGFGAALAELRSLLERLEEGG